MKKIYVFVLTCALLISSNINAQKKCKTIDLLDTDLTHFEKWLGVPHTTVKDLPEGTYQANVVTKGTPLGLNNDIKNVFTTSIENGEVILNISGELYGCITTKEIYENYHFSTMFKWGNKKWEPRLDRKMDSGILYHSYGEHGRFWQTWKTALEYQVQEQDLGDFISLGSTGKVKEKGPKVEIRGDFSETKTFDPNSEVYSEGYGYINAASEHDAPNGEWNLLELYVIGNNAVHVVNGVVVMVVENARKADGSILNKGQIQIQSEAAECYYKQMTIKSIKKFPKKIKKQVRFK